MYKRLNIARLKELCDDRDIQHEQCRYKRDYIDVLETYDVYHDKVIDDNNDSDVSGNSGATDEGPGTSDVENDEGDGGPLADNEVIVIEHPRNAGDNVQGDSEAVVALKLRLAIAQEERRAREEERKAREQERLAQERAYEMRTSLPATADGRLNVLSPAAVEIRDVKALLPQMADDSDPLTFFLSTERVLELNFVDKSQWARLIPAQLSAKALKIFARLSLDESRCYDTVKRAILTGYKLDANSYLKSFRAMRRSGQSTYKMFLTSLRDMAFRYFDAKGIDSYDKLVHAYIMEQFLNSLSDTVRQFVISKQPDSVERAAEYADLHFELTKIGRDNQSGFGAHKNSGQVPVRNTAGIQGGTNGSHGTEPMWRGGQNGTQWRANNVQMTQKPQSAPQMRFPQQPNIRQFSGRNIPSYRGNGRFQHRGAFFSNNLTKELFVDERDNVAFDNYECVNQSTACEGFCESNYDHSDFSCDDVVYDDEFIVPIFVNHVKTMALRDSGNFGPVIVDCSLVKPENVNYNKTVLCTGAFDNGQGRKIPTAKVTISSPWFGDKRNITVIAAVTKLPKGIPCILGNAFFRDNNLSDIIQVRGGQRRAVTNRRPDSDGATLKDTPNARGHAGHNNDAECQLERCNSATSKVVKFNTIQAASVENNSVENNSITTDTTTLDSCYDRHRQTDRLPPCNLHDHGEFIRAENADTAGQERLVSDTVKRGARNVIDTHGSGTGERTVYHGGATHDGQIRNTAARAAAANYGDDRQQMQPTQNRDAGQGDTALTDRNQVTTDMTAAITRQMTRTQREREPDELLSQTLDDFSNIDVTDIEQCKQAKTANIDDKFRRSVDANEFRQAQRTDKTLEVYWTRAKSGSNEFKVINGLLYRRIGSQANSLHDFALAVPEAYRQDLLFMAHDSLAGAHLGINKTKQRLKAFYFWPRMGKMIAAHVRVCSTCQLNAPLRNRDRQPMEPLVLNTHPFLDLSIDVMGGQLERTKKGNKYLLIVVCNVSKYVHALPLRNLRTQTIIDKLIEMFCMFGFPAILRLDQMPGFRSAQFKEMANNFGIKLHYSSVGHAQSHALAERTNLTLERIIRKYIHEFPKTWDQVLNYFLLALRESPNESTKFSPAEVVFGRPLRGLLAVARDCWENSNSAESQFKIPTAEYMKELSQKFHAILTEARKNVTVAQERMKRNYDKQATERHLQPGDLVLILVPSSNQKLTAHWMGPNLVRRRLQHNNYEVQVGKRLVKFHINSLRKFHQPSPETTVRQTSVIIEQDSADEMIATDAVNEPAINTALARTGDDTTQEPDGRRATVDTPFRSADGDGSDKSGDSTDVKFMMGEQLTDLQRNQMTDLLNKYIDVFDPAPGLTNLTMHKIELVDERPVWQQPYSIPEPLRDEVYQELKSMEEQGLIEVDTETRFNSPLIIIRKRSGGIRLVNNFKRLNEVTVQEKYTMTKPTELIYRIAGGKWVTRLDLRCFYYQILLSPECRRYTGFYTPWGVYHYNIMPQGLSGSPITAQRLIDRILRGAHKYANALQDDIAIHSVSWEDHLKHVEDILQRLRAAGLTANVSKCVFASDNLRILGFVVKQGCICVDDEKIDAITQWKLPRNKTQLRSFLGFMNFFNHFIYKYAEIASPLTDMLPRNKPDKLVWGSEEIHAFERLKAALISKPILRPPDFTKGFRIYSDASSVAIGGLLVQEDDDGNEYIVAFASHKLLPREKRYHIIEAELYAIVYCLQKFRQWIYSLEVKVFSDHRPLVYVNSLVRHSNRLARWILILQDFNVTTTYVKGENQKADALTRTPNMYE